MVAEAVTLFAALGNMRWSQGESSVIHPDVIFGRPPYTSVLYRPCHTYALPGPLHNPACDRALVA